MLFSLPFRPRAIDGYFRYKPAKQAATDGRCCWPRSDARMDDASDDPCGRWRGRQTAEPHACGQGEANSADNNGKHALECTHMMQIGRTSSALPLVPVRMSFPGCSFVSVCLKAEQSRAEQSRGEEGREGGGKTRQRRAEDTHTTGRQRGRRVVLTS